MNRNIMSGSAKVMRPIVDGIKKYNSILIDIIKNVLDDIRTLIIVTPIFLILLCITNK